MIARAAQATWSARQETLRGQRRRRRDRDRILAIDRLLEVLEQGHLAGGRGIDEDFRARLQLASHQVGLPLPNAVVRARNTRRLHWALLDWQTEVLDRVVPSRSAYVERDDEEQPEVWA